MQPEHEIAWLIGGSTAYLMLQNLTGEAGRGILGGPGGAADAAAQDAKLRGMRPEGSSDRSAPRQQDLPT